MSNDDRSYDRRDFIRQASAVGAALTTATAALAKGSKSSARSDSRVLGANDRINVAVIGVGGRGSGDAAAFARVGADDNSCQVVAVADCYQKRVNSNKEKLKISDGYLDYHEIINRKDIDAVVIATPDHWHARIALEAMDHGKDVYVEKPMCHTIDEAHQLVNTVKETKRVLQVGSQTTSADQWWKAKKAIADGMIGKMLMSQGSYHRNSVGGEWNYTIDPAAGPEGKGEDYIDWKMWLGSAPKRSWDADRFFRFRKYWDYSGGIATDLFYHVAAPLNICWDKPQFPHKVMAGGGIYGGAKFEEKREVPDTFHLIADYPEGHSAGAEFVDGEFAAHPRADSRSRRHHHHGGARPVRREDGKHHPAAGSEAIAGESRCAVRHQLAPAGLQVRHRRAEDPGGSARFLHDAHQELPLLHADAAEAESGCRDGRLRAGADHDGGRIVPARQGPLLRR